MTHWSKQRHAAAREMCDKATPGPWTIGDGWRGTAHGVRTESVHSEDPQDDLSKVCAVERGFEPGMDDAAFIAHARTDLPDALAEIERLRGALERACYALGGLLTGDMQREHAALEYRACIAAAALEEAT